LVFLPRAQIVVVLHYFILPEVTLVVENLFDYHFDEIMIMKSQWEEIHDTCFNISHDSFSKLHMFLLLMSILTAGF